MSLRNKPYHIALFLLTYFCVFDAHAQEFSSKEPIVVNGDHVTYLQDQKKVIGDGNISITYKDIVLTCEKVTVNLETHDAEAVGDVKITQKDAYFLGDKIDYNFDTRALSVDYGYLNANPFYGRAESLTKEAGKDRYTLKNCNVTTCDFDTPHYWMQAKSIKIYLEDKVVANNVIMKVKGFPILYIPYYVQPLRNIPKSHITIIPGRSKEWGYYVLGSARYYLNDKFRGDILLDYRSKKGLAAGVNHYMDTDVGRGAFKVYYTKENNKLAFDPSGAEMLRYRYQYRHRWDIKNADTVAIMEFNYLSDPSVIRDYFYNEYEELGGTPDTYLSFITAKENYTTEFLMRKQFNYINDVIERLPEYKIDILSYRIGNTSFYYSGNSSAVYLNQTYAKSTSPSVSTPKSVGTIRMDTYNQISYAARFFKSLSVTPSAGIRNTYFSRNRWGDTNLIRTVFQESVDASTKFYKIYDVNTNFLDLDINKLRHIITPSASYYHTHQPTISPDNLTQYDSIDAFDTANGVRMSLENKLQTKRMIGENMTSVDLLRFIASTDYMFRLDKNNIGMKSQKFNGVDFKLELIPYTWLYINSDMHVNTKKPTVETMNVDFVAMGGDRWSLSVGQRYYDLEASGKSYLVTMDGRYKINDKWMIRVYERFDLDTNKFEQQEYTLSRDLHCWIADFTFDFQDTNNATFWVILRMKAFPDYPIGLKQTYSRPRFGSAGAPASN